MVVGILREGRRRRRWGRGEINGHGEDDNGRQGMQCAGRAGRKARKGGQLVPEPVGTRPRVRLPEPLDPAPAFSSSCSPLGTRLFFWLTCPGQGKNNGEEKEYRFVTHYLLTNWTPILGDIKILVDPIYIPPYQCMVPIYLCT